MSNPTASHEDCFVRCFFFFFTFFMEWVLLEYRKQETVFGFILMNITNPASASKQPFKPYHSAKLCWDVIESRTETRFNLSNISAPVHHP